jgi:hypothetical protein
MAAGRISMLLLALLLLPFMPPPLVFSVFFPVRTIIATTVHTHGSLAPWSIARNLMKN